MLVTSNFPLNQNLSNIAKGENGHIEIGQLLIQWGIVWNVSTETLSQQDIYVDLPVDYGHNEEYFAIAQFNDSLRGYSAGLPNIVNARPIQSNRIYLQVTTNQTYDANNFIRWMTIGIKN